MKKSYFLIISLSFFNVLSAQIITFSNSQFKSDLLAGGITRDSKGLYLMPDSNGDKEIDVFEALNIYEVQEENRYITDVTGIEYFTNLKSLKIQGNTLVNLNLATLKKLEYLDCNSNRLKTINIAGLSNLTYLNCSNNGIKQLDLAGLSKLTTFNCSQNAIKNLVLADFPLLETANCAAFGFGDTTITSNTLVLQNLPSLVNVDCSSTKLTDLKMSGIDNLKYLNCKFNDLTTLDASNMYSAVDINLANNYLLNSIFIKNGRDETVSFGNNTNKYELKYICADEVQLSTLEYRINRSYPQLAGKCMVGSYCSFLPGGISYTVKGSQRWDSNSNGCDNDDPLFPFLKFNITNGIISQDFITDKSGNYNLHPQAGQHTITPVILENASFFSVLPAKVIADFPAHNSPFIQDFCIAANGTHPDLEVTLLPLNMARPGFNSNYKIVYKNKGNVIQSGSVNFKFDDAILDYISSNTSFINKTVDNIQWSFTNLKPFESREIVFRLNLNDPTETPAVNIDDVLKFTTTIESVDTDETPDDNVFTLNQTVVGSLDPNDKTCLEGKIITPGLIGEYVHYLIRFENKGTYSAENIVVKDMIDLAKFDISTLVPTSSSHSFVTKISEGNKVEFIFENIKLPFDDDNNDGYIAFKIKTKPTLVVGDSFANEANIYFDYNFPILTNKETSTFKTLGTPDFEFSNYLALYPVPANDILNIHNTQNLEIKSLEIYDLLGQIVIAVPNAQSVSSIDISKLRAGNYFIKVKSDLGSSSMKFIKK
ncbi:T9SS C-terminal target domain-containing protein [Flavobacterium circumlabens]|uniref:Repeat protein (TIGR01451 family)/predicted secreted protein (Por secretion system target) n=1 Tax=Flavobacterium circumlabens TaxID=2133765 RepID=A0A4Y7UB23_9FLAO|nr:T9SS type A sorting domain-containing protein [Flavobacterium circumlabens]TCN55337.1 putative repeat protein (TIGR01451 family)/predicted secreted protein (Por secretion system target) [Flavobacterium circumlabens]TEB43238.1 T9SS C-terminal target domain-containing protein [Flavobacterium circumlabens]